MLVRRAHVDARKESSASADAELPAHLSLELRVQDPAQQLKILRWPRSGSSPRARQEVSRRCSRLRG
eukprot:3985012-Heterocapsa_arctica.AAC.1